MSGRSSSIVYALAAVPALLGPLPALGQDERPTVFAGIIDLYAPAVVEVSAQRQHEDAAGAAGFFIGPGRLVTSRAALLGAPGATLTMDTGDSFAIERVLGENRDQDLVIVEAEVPPALQRGFKLDAVRAIPGEDALIIGPARQPGEKLTQHAFVETTIKATDSVIALHATAPLELAGAPVLNIEGRTIGVVTRAPGGDRTVITPVEAVLDIALTDGLALADWSAGKPLPEASGAAEADIAALRALPRPEGFGPAPEKFGDLTVIPARIERTEAGEVRIDGKYTLKGAGTPGDPYLISWDQLISAGRTLRPRQGQRQIPERVTMLHDKYVRLTGNIAFPLAEPEPRDLLLMLNQWDGCCIGIPPTPFDAIEVRLLEPADEEQRFAVFGTVMGKLQVSPYMVGEWLYGLYVMENATLTLQRVGGLDQ